MNTDDIVQNAIKELEEDFKNNRDFYFNEHDLHHVFFCKLSKLGNLVRPEYPTRRRFFAKKRGYDEFIRDKHSFPPRGKNVPSKSGRGHYDFAIFNEEFFNKYTVLSNGPKKEENRFERLSSKDVDTNKDQVRKKYLDIAIEFKYIVGQFSQETYEFDIFKLKEAEEVKNKIFLVFHRQRGMSDKRYYNILNWLKEKKAEETGIQLEIIPEF